jgi:hypothetical protein
MKTQYIARAAINTFIKPHTGEQVFIVSDLVKITTAKALLDLVKNTATLNGLGSPTIQLIPITQEQYKSELSSIPADTTKR